MKAVDMHGVRLVHCGEPWPHELPPCSKEMMRHLERNERIVSWLQPEGGGVADQFPAVRVRGVYYTLSLRMMKSVWRHVRLRKGFVNTENAPYGGCKLRIPTLLFTEKMRTQNRFNMMRMDGQPKERKPVQNASGKISQVVRQVMIPLLTTPIGAYVSFRKTDPSDVGRDLLDRLRETEPHVVQDRGAFVARMTALYDGLYDPPRAGALASASGASPELASQGVHEPPHVVPALDQGLVEPAAGVGLVVGGARPEDPVHAA